MSFDSILGVATIILAIIMAAVALAAALVPGPARDAAGNGQARRPHESAGGADGSAGGPSLAGSPSIPSAWSPLRTGWAQPDQASPRSNPLRRRAAFLPGSTLQCPANPTAREHRRLTGAAGPPWGAAHRHRLLSPQARDGRAERARISMTAEVAVLNKSAVALAADSAMTVGTTGKTYPTNKLFALTKYRPIGVMIYNSAEFMGIPWETLVKMHREHLGLRGKATVTDYARDFFGYVSNDAICPPEQQRRNLLRITADALRRIKRDTAVSHPNTPSGDTPDPRVLLADVIAARSQRLAHVGAAPSTASVDVEELIATHQDDINNQIGQIFDNFCD